MDKKPEKKRWSISGYFKGVRTEMKKVVWPTRSEMVSYTGVVIAFCGIFALLFWGFDSGILAGLRAVLNVTL